MTDEDLNAIRERLSGPVFMAHLTTDPCRCGGCNPTAHPKHPLYGELGRVREDVRSLLTEVERLRASHTPALVALAAAIDLLEHGGRKAAPSDRVFRQMLSDCRAALDRAVKTLRKA